MEILTNHLVEAKRLTGIIEELHEIKTESYNVDFDIPTQIRDHLHNAIEDVVKALQLISYLRVMGETVD